MEMIIKYILSLNLTELNSIKNLGAIQILRDAFLGHF